MADMVNRIDFTQNQQGWIYVQLRMRADCGTYEPLDLTDASVTFYIAQKNMTARMWDCDCEIMDAPAGQVRFWLPDTAFDGITWANAEEKKIDYFCRFWAEYWLTDVRIPIPGDGGWASVFRDDVT